MVLDALYVTNLRLQEDMANSLGEFYAVLQNENFGDPAGLASSVMGYETKVLLSFTGRYKKQFSESLAQSTFMYKEIGSDKSKERLVVVQKNLRLISERLSANISAIESATQISFYLSGKRNVIQKIWWKMIELSSSSSVTLENTFLVKAYLGGLDYEKGPGYSEETKFHKSRQPTTSIKGRNTVKILSLFMNGAQLQSSDFGGSNIKYWQLVNTFLDGAVLYGVSNYADANFKGSNWWMANFYNPGAFPSDKDTALDKNLLDDLFNRYNDVKIENAHPSVIEYMKSKDKSPAKADIP